MPALQLNPDNMVVAGKIKEVLEQRIGSDRFCMWFGNRVQFLFDGDQLSVVVEGEFARERLRRNYFRAIESAAAETLQRLVTVCLVLPGERDGMLTAGVSSDDAIDHSREMQPDEFPEATDLSGQDRLDRPMKSLPVRHASVADRSPGERRGGGPAPLYQFAMASATEPRHSQRVSNFSNQGTTSKMQPVYDRNEPAGTASPKRNQLRRPSLRVLSEPTTPDAVSANPPIAMATAPESSSRNTAAVSAAVAAPQLAGQVSVDSGAASGRPGRTTSSRQASPSSAARRSAPTTRSVKGGPETAAAHAPAQQQGALTFANFVSGTSNTLATTAAKLLAGEPIGSAPLCFWGATGTGKTHLLSAIRHELRSRYRLGRVLMMSAEEFTNDFLSCVRGTGLPAFRKRYRDVDALLIDNVQFLGGKNATVREMMYTIDTILSRRRPLVMAADRPPLEITGLSSDLAGRMSSGLVCGINPLDLELRRNLLRVHAQRSYLPWDEETIELLAQRISGDGRAVQGIVQMVSMLQRMYRRMPTLDEIVSQAGELLQRGPKVVALADVEKAVCTAFGLTANELRSDSKSRNVSQPRILAMYLSRQHTTAAFAEIGRYYGDRNHSTVIAAHRRVEDWIKLGQAVGGRGPKNLKVQDAIAAVENLLRIG